MRKRLPACSKLLRHFDTVLKRRTIMGAAFFVDGHFPSLNSPWKSSALCATGSASAFLQMGALFTIALAEPVAHENQAVTMH